jgi:hypothetical protein
MKAERPAGEIERFYFINLNLVKNQSIFNQKFRSHSLAHERLRNVILHYEGFYEIQSKT